MAKRLLLAAAVFTLLVNVLPIPLGAEVLPASITGAPQATACAQPAAVLPWLQPQPVPLTGCTAEYNCVHGTMVSCSSPFVGTCTSSGGLCGAVTCNGQTTFCPGACHSDHHCSAFCGSGYPNSYCDDIGCCVCV